MEKTVLLLTRHGETLENQKNILQGQLPGTLSPLGIQQAEMLAGQLEGEPLDAIVSSDLERSYKTAAIIGASRGMLPEPTILLREMNWGIYTGETLEEVGWLHLPESAESLEKLYQRAGAFVGYLQRKYAGKRVLAVGHGAFNRAVLTWLRGGTPLEMLELPIMKNTQIIRLVC